MHYTCRTTERSVYRSICIWSRDHQRPVCWQWHHSRPRRCARRVGLAPGGAARLRLQRAEQGQVHILEPGVCRWQPHQPLVDFGHDGGMVACADTARAIGLELGAGDGQGGKWRLFFCDQRNFGTITVCTDAAKLEGKLASLGPSWLPPGSLGLEEFQAIARHQYRNKRGAAVPLAKFLMDQAKTSGIGNCKALSRAHALCEIYCGAVASHAHAHCAAVRISFLAADILSETLYLAQIWPFARCGDLQDDDWVQIHAAASDVIERVRAPAAFCYCARLVISLPASLLTLPAP